MKNINEAWRVLGDREARVVGIGLRLRVDVTGDEVTYSLRNGGGSARLTLVHHGKEIEVTQVKPVTMPIPPAMPAGPQPTQPAGRAPRRRRANGASTSAPPRQRQKASASAGRCAGAHSGGRWRATPSGSRPRPP